MDKRTGFRPPADTTTPAEDAGAPPRSTGHAFYAAEARRALGVGHEPILPRIPAPVFHGMVGLVAAGMAVVARPQIVDARSGGLIDALLAAVAALAIVYYDRVVCPPEARPGIEAGVLPAAALLSEAVVLAATDDVAANVIAVPLTAVVIAVTPHLRAFRAAGLEDWLQRTMGELIRVVVMLPVCVVGASGAAALPRLPVVAAGAAVVAYDAMRADQSERPGALPALCGALVVGGALALAAVFAPAVRTQALGAAALLAIWHGLHGVIGHLAVIRTQRWVALEYAVFVIGGATFLGWQR